MEVEENAKIFTQEVHFTDKFFQIVNREAEVSKNKVVLREIGNDHNIFLLNNLLSKEECLQFIKLAETLGFQVSVQHLSAILTTIQKAGLAVNQQNEYRYQCTASKNLTC
jgi:predicted ABC-type ATPase